MAPHKLSTARALSPRSVNPVGSSAAGKASGPASRPELDGADGDVPIGLPTALLQLARYIKHGASLLVARASGLSDFEWRVLARACEGPARSNNELAENMDRTVAQVSRTVKRLVNLGLLESRPAPGGHRVAISPTLQGRRKYSELSALSDWIDLELRADLSEADVRAFGRVVSIMTRNAQSVVDRERATPGKGRGIRH